MYILTIKKMTKETKKKPVSKILEERTEKFLSIFNAERAAFKAMDYNFIHTNTSVKIVASIDRFIDDEVKQGSVSV